MTRLTRGAAALGAAALLALSLTACNGSDDEASSASDAGSSAASDGGDAGDTGGDVSGAPTDASKDDFCGAWNEVFTVLASTEADEEAFGKFQDAVAHLGEVGTPDGISADQRQGFEVFVDSIAHASYADVTKSNSDSLPGVSADEEKQAQGFVQWAATEECASIPSGVPSSSAP